METMTMPDKRKNATSTTTKRSKKSAPPFLSTARRFYGEAFGSRTRRAYLESLADWSELSEDDQAFTLAHLQYLNLLAQARTQHLLVQVRDLLDEVAEGIGDVLDPEDEDDGSEGGFDGDEELPPEPEELDDQEAPLDHEPDEDEGPGQHGEPVPPLTDEQARSALSTALARLEALREKEQAEQGSASDTIDEDDEQPDEGA